MAKPNTQGIILHKGDIVRLIKPIPGCSKLRLGLHEVGEDVVLSTRTRRADGVTILFVGYDYLVHVAVEELGTYLKLVSSTRPSQRYKQFRNFLINDMKVTPSSIHKTMVEAAREEVIRFLGSAALGGRLEKILDSCIRQYVEEELKKSPTSVRYGVSSARDVIRRMVAEELAKQFEVEVSVSHRPSTKK